MHFENYGNIDGHILIIGFGSIAKGLLYLLERHFNFKKNKLTIIDPLGKPDKKLYDLNENYSFYEKKLTKDNYKKIIDDIFINEKGICINLSVNTSSLDIMIYCRKKEILYIDTVVEPWEGYYNDNIDNTQKTNYALRQAVRDEKNRNPTGSTAISCCGANPGMVSWLVKEALIKLSENLGYNKNTIPSTRLEWAILMKDLGVKGIHIAERDSQKSKINKRSNIFVNTWSVDGFLSESFQPAELGWGTHENWFPPNGMIFDFGCKSSIWLNQLGAKTLVYTWCPTHGAQYGFLITHNEAISISDYFTLGNIESPIFRPTCHYAYHPCDDAILSLHETLGSGRIQSNYKILQPDEILDGYDELGVLLYGHEKNALWYGSILSNEQAKQLVPYQNATGLQVSSAVIAGISWALNNPESGIVEAEEMDFKKCLSIQKPYLGSLELHFTDWNPLNINFSNFPREVDILNPWSFKNVLAKNELN